MRTILPCPQKPRELAFVIKTLLFVFIALFCFNTQLYAGIKHAKNPSARVKRHSAFLRPTISYSSPHVYVAGDAIAPIVPSSSGVAVASYGNKVAPIGSGFASPYGVAIDAAGNIYVADAGSNSIKKIPVGGGSPVVLGSGFNAPVAVAVDAAGNVYVGDNGNNAVKKIPAGGGAPVTILAAANQPYGVAVDAAGNVFVTDYGNSTVKEIPVLGGAPIVLGAGFLHPSGVAVDAVGNIYVGDSGNNVVKKIPVGSNVPVIIGPGFNNPTGVVADAVGNVFVTDQLNNMVKEIPFGGGAQIAIGSGFSHPSGVSIDAEGIVYVADELNNAIETMTPIGGYYLSTALPAGLSFDIATGIFSGTPTATSPATSYAVTAYNSSGGTSTALSIQVNPITISYTSPQAYVTGVTIAPLSPVSNGVDALAYNGSPVTLGSGFSTPRGVAVDVAGNVYEADFTASVVKKIPVGGGAPVIIGSGFNGPDGVAVDVAGNVYVSDYNNNAIKKIPVGGGAPVVIGSGIVHPYGLALDNAGNVYVADYGNNAVKQIAAAGGVTANVGLVANPIGVAVDAAGNVYVGEANTNTIKKMAGGVITTFASGFSAPYGVAVDAAGNVFVGDAGHSAVKELPAAGGGAVTIGSGFNLPTGVAVDAAGNVFVADYNNGNVKKIRPVGGYYIDSALPAGLSFNNATGTISGMPTVVTAAKNYTVTGYNSTMAGAAVINIGVAALSILYNTPPTYVVGTAITPLTPVNNGVAAAAYTNSPAVQYNATKPYSLAFDGAGNLYMSQQTSFTITKYPVGGGATVSLGSGFTTPEGIAADAAGNVYVADYGNNAIKKIPVGGGAPVALGSGFINPTGVAVDGAGNVYVADFGNNAVKEIPVAGGAPITLGSGFAQPFDVAVDAAGNVYVSDGGSASVKKIPVAGGAPVVVGSGITSTYGLTVDFSGNVFVADRNNNTVKEIPANGGATINVSSGFSLPYDAVVDAIGNLYVADFGNNAIKLVKPVGGYYLNKALPVGLNFDNSTGIISGTPTIATPAANYSIRGFNSASAVGFAVISIKVNQFPPPTISYASPQTFTKNVAISPVAPTHTNVSAAAYGNTATAIGSGFSSPIGVAADAAGNVYVADAGSSLVKKIPVGGGIPVIIGSGYAGPTGVATDNAGNVYVTDNANNALYKIPVGGGATVTVATGFNDPIAVAVDGAGNLYVADTQNNAIKELPVGGGPAVTLGSGFISPAGVAVDAAGNVYLSDNGNNAVKKIPVGGGAPVIIGSGFSSPLGVAVDASGNVFVGDFNNNAIKMIPVGGGAPVSIGSGFSHPFGVAVDALGNILVADDFNAAVKKITPVGGYYISPFLPAGLSFNNNTGIISGTPTTGSPTTNYTVSAYNVSAGNTTTINITVNVLPSPTISYNSPNVYTVNTAIASLNPTSSGVAAPGFNNTPVSIGSGFLSPIGITVDAAGNVYVADRGNNAVYKMPAGGGVPVSIGSGFNQPHGVAVDIAGNVYVTDYGNHLVKKIPVGGGAPVSIGSGFNSPFGIAVDAAGNVYISDQNNNAIQKIPAGGGAQVGIAFNFSAPGAVAVDAAGNVFVADAGNNLVKKIPVGGGLPVTVGPSFNQPYGVAVDMAGNVYMAEFGTNAIKEIPVGGGAPVTLGSGFNGPTGVASDSKGILYVADYANSLVKKIDPIGGYYISGLPAGLSFDGVTGAISGTPTAVTPATDYTVTAYNAGGNNSATVNIQVAANANLSALALSSGALSPVFAAGTISYTANVTNATASITVTPTASAGSSTIKVNGSTVASGTATASLPLVVGPNTITTIVTAGDGVTTKTYTVTVTRAASANANLTNLKINGGNVALSPAFNFNVLSYTATVTNVTNTVKITPAAADANATIKVNGVTVASGTASGSLPLVTGQNIITTVVTAQDGSTTKAYTITITKTTSTDATLAGLSLSQGTLSPAFGAAINNYSATVASAVTSLTVTPTTNDPAATVKVNGVAVSSGTASGAIALNLGQNVINIVVTAQDGTTTDNYSITVGRGAANVNLTNLKINGGNIPLTPLFNFNTTSYTASVPNATASVKITPALSDANATVTVNGTMVASGTQSGSLPLNAGLNVINTVVRAQNGVTQKTYTITITRAAAPDATLSALQTSSGTLSPVFAAGTISYTASVTNATSSVTVTPTTTDPAATVTVNGSAVTSGTASAALPLVVGQNILTTIVTALDGITTKTYTITVTRAPSANDNLSNLKINSGNVALSPAFNFNTLSYTASVGNAIASVKITPATSDANATVTVNGATVVSGTQSPAIALVTGPNTITTVVTAQDGATKKTYTITITRTVGPVQSLNSEVSVQKPIENPGLANDGIVVRQGISPNGDGLNDYLVIDGISNYPDNKLTIMNRSGQLVFETKGYDNSARVFDGHSNKTGAKQLPGTYFYSLDYTVKGVSKHKTGFIVLKY